MNVRWKVCLHCKQSPTFKTLQIRLGDKVHYRHPVNITGPQNYDWEEAIGTVEIVDFGHYLALISPMDDPMAWIWINLGLLKVVEK